MVWDKATSIQSVSINAPVWLHKRLRGKKMANIREILKDDSRIHVEFKEEPASIRIEGPKEEVTRVKAQLEQQITELLASLVCDKIQVKDASYFKHIIGKQGANGKFPRWLMTRKHLRGEVGRSLKSPNASSLLWLA